MVQEVTEALVNDPHGTYLDATAGGGGHVAAMLELLASDATVVAMDRDEDAVRHLLDRFAADRRVRVVRGNFAELVSLEDVRRFVPYSGVLFDFGLSSHQIDEASRGFSFMSDGPLDMRMDRSNPLTAADVVNGYTVDELARLLRDYGDVRGGRRLSERIIAARPYETTGDLAKAVGGGRGDVKLLAKVFQAIRIEVNGELAAIESGLETALNMLASEGRMVTLAYHSLEDRRVKRFFRKEAGEPDRDDMTPVELRGPRPARLRQSSRSAVKPSEDEKKSNPRARSARMRIAEKL
jgi:16S rRNA (cytosine1402-N4)-methyltransferase